MRICTTEAKKCGGAFELLLVLPVFLILLWGAALLSFLSIQRSRTEQAAWVYGEAVAHGSGPDSAERLTRATTRLPGPATVVSSEGDCLGWLPFVPKAPERLPASFQAIASLHCPARHEVRIRKGIPSAVLRFLRAAPGVGAGPSSSGALLETEARTWTPGDSFRESLELRQALWQEAMARAGFGALPLQLLAVPELSSVAGADLGGPASEVLRECGKGGVP